MKWLWFLLLVGLVAGVSVEWMPVETQISFEAGVSGGVESGEYSIVVSNEYDVAMNASLGLNFESIPSELEVAGFDAVAEYEGAEGAQYFVYFGLGAGESREIGMRYVREVKASENFWEKEYAYNSPVKFIFDAGDGNTYYEKASYSGELSLDEVDLVRCRDCLHEGNVVSVEGGQDFSLNWVIQKFPVRPEIAYSIFTGFIIAFLFWEITKWAVGGEHKASP